MASPSNKKDGSAYLEKLKKGDLIKKVIATESKLMEEELNHESTLKELSTLQKQYSILQKKYNRVADEDLTKRVLEFKARNLVPTMIREKFLLENKDIPLKQIKDIYNMELNLELEAYYKKCQENYAETIRIDTKLYKQSSIDEINRLLSKSYELLEIVDKEDVKSTMSILDSINKYIATRDNLMKNIDDTSSITEQDELLNESTEDFKSNSSKIIKLFKENIKVIGSDS